MEILPIPRPPKNLIEAARQKRLVVFAGAGVSRLAGCKSWDDLAITLVEACYRANTPASSMNFRLRESLAKMGDNKMIITICQSILPEQDFKATVSAALTPKEQPDCPDIYRILKRLECSFITTNADKLLDDMFVESRRFRDPMIFETVKLSEPCVVHIHGSIDEFETMVFTTNQYFQRYKIESFIHFLARAFKEYTLLFIGYGLAELQILDLLFSNPKIGSGAIQHYMLKNYFTGEGPLVDLEQRYYKQFGIEIIPFAIDEWGHRQLERVVREWVDEVRENTSVIQSKMDLIEGALPL
jgi:hypothetical protein